MMGENCEKQMLIYAPSDEFFQMQMSGNLPIRNTPEYRTTFPHVPMPILPGPYLLGPATFGLEARMQFSAIVQESQHGQP